MSFLYVHPVLLSSTVCDVVLSLCLCCCILHYLRSFCHRVQLRVKAHSSLNETFVIVRILTTEIKPIGSIHIDTRNKII